jgi:hypothetical protein
MGQKSNKEEVKIKKKNAPQKSSLKSKFWWILIFFCVED